MLDPARFSVSRVCRLGVLIAPLLLVACGKGMRFEMFNTADLPVHLWVDGFESMGDANRVEPEGYRSFKDEEGDWSMVYTVNAGRNDAVLVSATCSSENEKTDAYEVFFDEQGVFPSISCLAIDPSKDP